MTDAIDLLILNTEAPVVDAISATVCSRWSDAADLWFDVHGRRIFSDLARRCGMEAALWAGEFDLAAYFEVGGGNVEEWPELQSGVLADYRFLRTERKRHFLGHGAASSAPNDIADLVRLRYYKKAVGDIFASSPEAGILDKWVAPLARCYHALGFHEALVALHSQCPKNLNSGDIVAMVHRAEEMLRREGATALEHFILFENRHPAGPLLAAIVQERQV